MTMSIPSQDEPFTNRPVNDLRDLAKPVKAINLPQDVPSTSDYRLIELENQDTQYYIEDLEQAFVEYASSHTDEAGDATRAIPNMGFNLVDVEGVWFGFFLQMGFTLILATLDGLDVGLLGDVIGGDDCDDDE
ncbi:hypothetical protein Tco_0179040 [Tanacetum coccineum]